MFRYIVVAWAVDHPEQVRVARFLASRLKAARWDEYTINTSMSVFQTGGRAGFMGTQVLPGAAGVVIGVTFEGTTDPLDDTVARTWSVTPSNTQAILASRGRWLIDHCWGNYVAILKEPASPCIWILKDPTGNLPCFIAAARGVSIICSSVADLAHLRACRFTINRAYLKARVIHGVDSRQQPLNEVEQVRRGECIELDVDTSRLQSRQFYWCPQTFANSDDTFEDSDLAAKAMRACVRMSTHTWAARDTQIVHRLSGGLDSSIVAGCLKDAPNRPRICCYTYFTPGAPSDERPWARLVASRLGCEHREVPMLPQDIELQAALYLPLQVEPTSILGYTLRSTIEQAIATEIKASMVFNGDGGDSLFGAGAVRFAASEYLRRRGLRTEVLRIAGRVALYTHQSTWRVLYQALRDTLTGERFDSMAATAFKVSRLITRDAVENEAARAASVHPWFAGEEHVPWEIAGRLGMLMASPAFYDVLPRDDVPAVISPLYSQPVVETLLRIPLYRLFEGGRDRGLARRAFAGDVPEQILGRLWKDRAPGFHDRLVFHNRAFLREVFLDGVLVREGLLGRIAIEQALADSPSKNQVLPGEIFRHLDVEMWARAWESSASHTQRQNLATATY